MSERNWIIFISDIIDCCNKITKYICDMDLENFSSDERTYDAVSRNLITIGEAAKSIPEKIRNKYPQIDWRKIIALRNIIIHVYFKLDINIIWDLAKNKIPELLKSMKQILNEN